MKKEVIEIQVQGTGEGVKQVDKINDSIKDTKVSAKEASNETKELSKSAVDGAKNFKFMGVSINGVSKTLKLLKISLIATGIGAIVVAVGALAAAFLSTQAGVDKLNSVLTPLKTVLSTIWGIAQKLGEGLFQMVSGDISGGFDTMADSVENLGDQLGEAWERGKELADLLIQIEERAVNQNLVLSRVNRHYAEQLEIAEDINKTEDERREAFKNAIAAQETITKLKKADLEEQIRAIKIGEEDNDTNREAQKERNDLIAQQEDIVAQGFKARTLLLKKLNVVKAEGGEIVEGETFEDFERRQEATRKRIEEEEKERERVAEQRQQDNEDLITWEEEQEQIKIDAEDLRLENAAKAAAEKKKADDKALDDERKIAEAKASLQFELASQIGAALGAISQLFEQGTAASKTAALAEVVIGTGIGFIQGLDIAQKSAKATGPAAAFAFPIFYATQIAAVLSAAGKAKNILKQVKGGGSAGGGISAPSKRGDAQQAQAPDFNIVGSSGTNQLAGAIGQQTQQPVKAYVVGSDMTTQQQLDRNIIDSASVG